MVGVIATQLFAIEFITTIHCRWITITIFLDGSCWFFFLQVIYQMGDYAVPLFWCISGFVFALVYLEQKENVSGKKFFINRFARLYPLHFATLIIVTLLQLININLFGKFQIEPANDIYRFILHLFLRTFSFRSNNLLIIN